MYFLDFPRRVRLRFQLLYLHPILFPTVYFLNLFCCISLQAFHVGHLCYLDFIFCKLMDDTLNKIHVRNHAIHIGTFRHFLNLRVS